MAMKSKKSVMMSVLVIGLLAGNFSQASVKVDAPITRVTVYPDRAMITRTAKIDLQPGDHTLVFENIPDRAVDPSFRGSLHGSQALMMGLNRRVVRHTEIPQKKVAALDEQIYKMEKYQRQAMIDRKEVFEQQKKMLLSIGFKSGEEMSKQMDKGGLEIDQWRQAFGFVGDALRALNDSLSTVQREMDDIDRELSKLKADRSAIAGKLSLQTKTVEIDVRMIKAGSIAVDLEYVIGGASWKPIYDARLNEENEKVDFSCFGEVAQNTGEDWNDIDLILSTALPTHGTGPGKLDPWILSLYDPEWHKNALLQRNAEIQAAPVATVNDLLARETGIAVDSEGDVYLRGGRGDEAQYLYDIIPSAYNTAFRVLRKVSVVSGEEAVRAPLGSYALDRKMAYRCRPKKRQGVYRLATVTNQDEVPLLPGQVSIFAGSDYLGVYQIDRFIAPGDEFDLPFGQDNSIEVKRELTKNLTSPKGDKIRVDQTVEITLVCNSKTAKKITVEERLPVSQDSRVKAEMRDCEPDKDKLDEEDNSKAVWTIELMPGEEKTITFSVRIEYPAGMQLVGI